MKTRECVFENETKVLGKKKPLCSTIAKSLLVNSCTTRLNKEPQDLSFP